MPLTPSQNKAITTFCRNYSEIKALYLFGSRFRGDATARSDFDFAVLFTPATKKNTAKIYLSLLGKLVGIVKCDYVDLIDLNSCENLALKNNIVMESQVIFERGNFRVPFEVVSKHQYYDFCLMQDRVSVLRT